MTFARGTVAGEHTAARAPFEEAAAEQLSEVGRALDQAIAALFELVSCRHMLSYITMTVHCQGGTSQFRHAGHAFDGGALGCLARATAVQQRGSALGVSGLPGLARCEGARGTGQG